MTTYEPRAAAAGTRPALVLSILLAASAAAAAVASLARPDLIHGPAVSVGNLRGTALVVLAVALPVLLLAIAATRRGSLVGLAAWTGALLYIGYQGVLFLFGAAFNGLFPLYLGLLAFAGWGLIALLPRVPVAAYGEAASERMPARALAGWLIVLALAFYLLWAKAIVPALFASEHPAFLEGTGMITGPGQILDLAFALPTTVLGGVLLWRRTAWGTFLGGALLVMLSIESLSIGVDQSFGSAADPTSTASSAALAPVFAVIALVGLAGVVAWARGLRR